MKKKYLALCFFLLTSIFSYSQEEERPALKLESQIRLLALNSQFEKADILVKENFDLNTYDYYFYLGYIQEAKRNYREAIKNYNEAYKINYTRDVAMSLLRNYIDTKAYKRANSLLEELTVKDEKISEAQRFQDLKILLTEADARNQEMGVNLKLSYNDNLDNVKSDKTNNLFTTLDFYYVKVKDINEKISTNNYFVYLNDNTGEVQISLKNIISKNQFSSEHSETIEVILTNRENGKIYKAVANRIQQKQEMIFDKIPYGIYSVTISLKYEGEETPYSIIKEDVIVGSGTAKTVAGVGRSTTKN